MLKVLQFSPDERFVADDPLGTLFNALQMTECLNAGLNLQLQFSSPTCFMVERKLFVEEDYILQCTV